MFIKRIYIIFVLSALAVNATVHAEPGSSFDEQSVVEKVTSWYMDNINYSTVTLLMTVESSFIPFPSEVIVPPAAYKASQDGNSLNLVLVVFFATLGAMLGSVINYYLALYLGRPVLYRFADSKFGKLCLLSSEKVKKAEDYFVKHGKSSTLIGRLIPGIRQLISIPAGLSRMRFGSFLLYTFIGAFAWNIILTIIGCIAHGKADLIKEYSKELSYFLLGLGLLFVLYLVYNAFFKKKSNRTI